MICAFCQSSETKVIDSRLLQHGRTVRRRRECESCKKRFTTYEEMEVKMPVIVKRDGRREDYNRQKLLGGFKKACQKRPVSSSKIDNMVEEMEREIRESSAKELPSSELGELAIKKIYDVDPVAYVRFAAIYWNFKDIDDFVAVLRQTPDRVFPRRRR